LGFRTRAPEGGGGAWPEGRTGLLVEALGSPSCVIEELDVGGFGLPFSHALTLASSCRTLKTIALHKLAIPVSDLRSARAVSMRDAVVTKLDAEVVGELVKGNTALSRLDLSGSEVPPGLFQTLADAVNTSGVPLTSLDCSRVDVSPLGATAMASLLASRSTSSTQRSIQ